MIENVHDHLNDEEIVKLQIEPDSLRWKEMLEFHNTEVQFLRSLLFFNFTEKLNPDVDFTQFLLEKLDKFEKNNSIQLNTLLNFRNNLYKFRECDEVLCENNYLKEFLILKETLTKHFKDFRTDKRIIFDFFGKGFDSKFEEKNYFI